MLPQFLVNGFITGLLYSLAAIGFALVYNTTRIFHFAAAAIYVVAAYIFYYAYHTLSLPIFLAGMVSVFISSGLSVLCEEYVYRPQYRKNASPNVVMISSLGLMTVLVNLIAMYFGNETRILDNQLQPTYSLGALIITWPQLLQLLLGGTLHLVFILFLRYSRFGLKVKALSNNPELFGTLGFNTFATRSIVFALSGIFLASGSCLAAYDVGMDPHTGMPILISAIVAMIIGGIGKLEACLLGGLALGIIQSLIIYQFAANWQNALTFVALLLFLFFRPQGILGYKRRTV